MSTNTTTTPEFEALDDARYITTIVLGALSSTLSLCGSSFVIFMVFRDMRTKLLHRLLFAISVSDLINSLSLLLMPYLIPSSLELPGALGNNASCTTMGFFMMLSFKTTCCYSAYLSLYYYLSVCRSWKEHDFTKRPLLEISAHTIALLVSIPVEIAAATTESFNPTPLINNVCSYAASPWGCVDLDNVDCVRSSKQTLGILTVFTFPVLFGFSIGGFVCTGLVFEKVRSTLRRSSMYRFPGSQETASRGSFSDPETRQIRDVGIQGILYSLAYLQALFWTTAVVVVSSAIPDSVVSANKSDPGFYALTLLFWTLFPIQVCSQVPC
jgi:hypothetical protein